MAEVRGEFEIVVSVKAKSEIGNIASSLKVKDKVSKTNIACRHCEIELKYSGNISNFGDNLIRKHSAVFLLFFLLQVFSPFPKISARAVNQNHRRYYTGH